MASDQEAPTQPVTMQDLQDMWDSADSADQPQDAPQQAQDNTLPDQPEELDQEVEEVAGLDARIHIPFYQLLADYLDKEQDDA